MRVILLILAVSSGCRSVPLEPTWTSIGERFAGVPFATLMSSLAPLRDTDGEVLGNRAADCGACHDSIYSQWQRSTHAGALRDLQYLAELSKPESPRWLCLNCHIPLQDQRRYRVAADSRVRDGDIRRLEEKPNPTFDAELQQEAVTCATCHLRDVGGVTSVVAAHPTRDSDAPHPVAGDARMGDICLRCHDPGPVRLTPTFFCWFETARELAGGPADESCVDCHMPKAKDGTRAHHWVGGGVPKEFAGFDTLLERGWSPGLAVNAVVDKKQDGVWQVTIDYANARAGHWLPTADPERFILIEAALVGAGGEIIARERLRLGQVWDWGDASVNRPAKRLRDSRLKPRERRRWSTKLAGDGAVGVRVSAAHVRLTADNMRHMKQTDVSGVADLRSDVVDRVRQLEKHYPAAVWLFRQELDLSGLSRKLYSREELVDLSKATQGWSVDEHARRLSVAR